MNGNWTADSGVKTLVPANANVGQVSIQHYGGDPVFLGFGGDLPEVGKGICISAALPLVTISDHRSNLPIYGICDAEKSASGGFVTA